jgi:hypothetical protein
MLHMADRHLDDLRFFDPTSTLLQVFRWYKPAQIGQTVVHAISSTFLDDPMRHWILLQQKCVQLSNALPLSFLVSHSLTIV